MDDGAVVVLRIGIFVVGAAFGWFLNNYVGNSMWD